MAKTSAQIASYAQKKYAPDAGFSSANLKEAESLGWNTATKKWEDASFEVDTKDSSIDSSLFQPVATNTDNTGVNSSFEDPSAKFNLPKTGDDLIDNPIADEMFGTENNAPISYEEFDKDRKDIEAIIAELKEEGESSVEVNDSSSADLIAEANKLKDKTDKFLADNDSGTKDTVEEHKKATEKMRTDMFTVPKYTTPKF